MYIEGKPKKKKKKKKTKQKMKQKDCIIKNGCKSKPIRVVNPKYRGLMF